MAKTTSTSVEMMKREKELETRRKELEGLLEEVRHEETKLEQSLQEKGWVKKDGDWGIE
jgi:prefoldin subunit 5